MEGAVVDGDRLLPAAGRNTQSREASHNGRKGLGTRGDYFRVSMNTVCSADKTVPPLISTTQRGRPGSGA